MVSLTIALKHPQAVLCQDWIVTASRDRIKPFHQQVRFNMHYGLIGRLSKNDRRSARAGAVGMATFTAAIF